MPEIQQLVDLDFKDSSQIKNVLIDKVITDPAPVGGKIIYNTADEAFKWSDGTAWYTTSELVEAGNALTLTGNKLDVAPGTGLEISADTLRLAAAAAGFGLTGGAGSALSVGAGYGIKIESSDFVAVDTSTIPTLATVGDVRENLEALIAEAETAAEALFSANDALVYKGTIDCSANPEYRAADAGHTYKVSVAGKIGGASGTAVEIGDTLLCTKDGSAKGTQAAVGANWDILQTNLTGAVTGPTSSTDDSIATFDGTSGKVVQDGGNKISDLAKLKSPNSFTQINTFGSPLKLQGQPGLEMEAGMNEFSIGLEEVGLGLDSFIRGDSNIHFELTEGNIFCGGSRLKEVAEPSEEDDVATKNYVDDQILTTAPLSGHFTITGNGSTTEFESGGSIGEGNPIIQVRDSEGKEVVCDTQIKEEKITVSFTVAPAVGENYIVNFVKVN